MTQSVPLKLTRTRGHVVNMGNYESLRTEATVEMTVGPENPGDMDKFYKAMDIMLEKALARDLKESGALTNVEDSYILSWDGYEKEE